MKFKLLAALAAGLLSAAPAFATTVVIDFEGSPLFDSVGDYYNGTGGPNLGVSFGGDALTFPQSDALGTYFSNSPIASSSAAMAPVGANATMNVATGFSGTASFFYSSIAAGSVNVWSGLNGTGSLVGTFALSGNAQTGCSDSAFCHWDLASIGLTGVGKSITFGSAYDADPAHLKAAFFDNVTVNAVPEPGSFALLGFGLAGLGAVLARRKKTA